MNAEKLADLWQLALAYLTLTLGAGRAIVLHEEDPDRDFEVVAARGIEPQAVWDDDSVDFTALSSCYTQGSSQFRPSGHPVVCVPLRGPGGRVVGLLYGDQPQVPFSATAVHDLERFGQELAVPLGRLRASYLAARSRGSGASTSTRTRLGGLDSRVALQLVELGLLTPEEGSAILVDAEAGAQCVEQLLVDRGRLRELQIVEALGRAYHLKIQLLEPAEVSAAALNLLTDDQISRLQAIPLALQGESVRLGLGKLDADAAVREFRELTGREAIPVYIGRLCLQRLTAELAALRGQTETQAPLLGGRYQVKESRLACRFSTLYLAHDQQLGCDVYLRKFEGPITQADERRARRQTLIEGRLLSKLRHRNLPQVHEVFDGADEVYLVLEELPQQSLADFVHARSPVDAGQAARILEQLLSVLAFLHGQDPPIVHRDLRPDSILISSHGVIKLAEFGLAKMQEAPQASEQTAFRAAGSPHYAAAEQLLSEPSQPLHDLYSVGAILYLVATGDPPPKSLERLTHDNLVPLATRRPDYPAELADVIGRLLAMPVEERPESAGAALELLAPKPRAPLSASQAVAQAAQRFARHLSSWQLFARKPPREESLRAVPAESAALEDYRLSFPEVDLRELDLSREVGRRLPESLARAAQGVCFGEMGPQELALAVKDPTDVHTFDLVSLATGGAYKPQLYRSDSLVIDHALEYIYHSDHLPEKTSWGQFLEQKHFETEALILTQDTLSFGAEEIEGPVVEAVDRLIKEAISAGASDIHLEPFADSMDVRYRVDGVLHKVNEFEPAKASMMVKRIKVMANMDIAQERVTQGGRISLRIGQSEFDLRVSVVPVPVGESIVMRVLKKGAFNLRLHDLGFDPEKSAHFSKVLGQPYGMLLVCGPTGSGKSTTLYASLKEIQRPDRKLLTVEDPIEYQMPGIIQVQVNNAPREIEKRVTFSKALREFLRQDPDVILVGEIRDPETAEIAIQAALTGHLLLSTIHTNDSVGIIARLRDMGCEPFLISSTLIAGLAQRLARRICEECKAELPLTAEYENVFRQAGLSEGRVYTGRGCRACNETGYRGRVGLYELLEISPEVRTLINRVAPEEEIREAAAAQGFRPLLLDGLTKAAQGLVTVEEVQRVCKTL